MSTIGERLLFIRKKKLALSREKFVEGLEITPKSLERYENNETSPDANFLYGVWMKFHDQLSLDDLDWLITGNRRAAAEEEAEYKVVPMTTPEEQEYLEKLLRVLRNPATKRAIQENIDTFLKVPKPEDPLDDEKKGGMRRS